MSTSVTGTVTDSDGTAWANGTWSATFRGTAASPGLGGQSVFSGALDGSGALSVSLPQSGSSWIFRVRPNASAPGFETILTISGSSQSISAQLSAASSPPRFNAGQFAFGYADVEVITPVTTGASYYNVILAAWRQWTGSAWQTIGAGGGATGATGATGPAGPTGATGATGSVGPTGATGATGAAALSVTDGTTTVTGVTNLTSAAGAVTTAGAGEATITATPLPFFGARTSLGWSRPALAAFSTWLNQGGAAVGVGASGDTPSYSSGAPITPGTIYAPGDVSTIAGGTLQGGSSATQVTITDTQLISATIVAGGTGGTPGSATVIGTTGAGPQLFILNVTIGVGGDITSIDSIANAGDYTTNPTVLAVEPVADNSSSGITGATVSVVMGALIGKISRSGAYTAGNAPTNPASEASSSGSGTGATWSFYYTTFATATDNSNGLPLVLGADQDVRNGNNINSYPVNSLITGVMKNTPAGDSWEILVGMAAFTENWNTSVFFLPLIIQGGSGNALVVNWIAGDEGGGDNAIVNVLHYTSIDPLSVATLVSGPSPNSFGFGLPDYFEWFKIVNDGTNLTIYISPDGLLFSKPIYTETLASFLTSVSKVGFGFERSNNSANPRNLFSETAILWNWQES